MQVIGRVSTSVDSPGVESSPVGLEFIFDQHAVCLVTTDGQISLWQYEMGSEVSEPGFRFCLVE